MRPHTHAFLLIVSALLLACDSVPQPSNSLDPVHSLADQTTLVGMPRWITEPSEFPEGLKGTNNCTFALGQPGAQWDFHSDGGCWERQGPDGWTRQQQHLVHVPSIVECGGGPGDVSPIRACREGGAGQPGPCPFGPKPITGPNGCALCVAMLVCHNRP